MSALVLRDIFNHLEDENEISGEAFMTKPSPIQSLRLLSAFSESLNGPKLHAELSNRPFPHLRQLALYFLYILPRTTGTQAQQNTLYAPATTVCLEATASVDAPQDPIPT